MPLILYNVAMNISNIGLLSTLGYMQKRVAEACGLNEVNHSLITAPIHVMSLDQTVYLVLLVAASCHDSNMLMMGCLLDPSPSLTVCNLSL